MTRLAISAIAWVVRPLLRVARQVRSHVAMLNWRVRTWRRMVDELFYMAGYTELLTSSRIDDLRGIPPGDSKVGLFKENREIRFYWFTRHGRIRHSNHFRLNNVGLISQKTYEIEKGPDEYRIVVLGDEMTAATTTEISWPDCLQDVLCSDAALLAHLKKTKCCVLNFGWPDAGFAHMADVWRDKAKGFDPDLVLVNVAGHNFSRYGTGARLFFRGQANARWRHECVAYRSPSGLEAWMSVICTGSRTTLKSPECTSSRPFALYLPQRLAENPRELAAVQEQIVRDYAGATGIWRNIPRVFHLTANTTFDSLLGRAIETEPAAPATNGELITHAREHLRRILDDHPNVVFTHNPLWLQVLDPTAGRPWVEALVAADPAIDVVDMRAYLPLDVDRKEIESWYQVPHAAEKWSSKGHRIYAGAQARLLTALLTTRGASGGDGRASGDPTASELAGSSLRE